MKKLKKLIILRFLILYYILAICNFARVGISPPNIRSGKFARKGALKNRIAGAATSCMSFLSIPQSCDFGEYVIF